MWSEIIQLISRASSIWDQKFDLTLKLHDTKWNYHFITAILKSQNSIRTSSDWWWHQTSYLVTPILINIYSEAMLRDALSGVDEGIRVGGLLIMTVRFADDQATLATSVKGQQLMMDKMQETAGEYRKMISVKKTN